MGADGTAYVSDTMSGAVWRVPPGGAADAWVVGPDVLLAVMATDDDPKKPDPIPVDLPVEPTRRDLVSSATERRMVSTSENRVWTRPWKMSSK